jgi:hypothetical protein
LVVCVRLAGSQLLGEGGDIQPVHNSWVELDILAIYQQQRSATGIRLKALLQIVERAAQIFAQLILRMIWPEQCPQPFAAVWAISFYSQIGEQRPPAIRFNGRDRPPFTRHLKGTKQGKMDRRHFCYIATSGR